MRAWLAVSLVASASMACGGSTAGGGAPDASGGHDASAEAGSDGGDGGDATAGDAGHGADGGGDGASLDGPGPEAAPLVCNGSVCVLATGQADPMPIVVAGGFLYWSNYANDTGTGTVVRCPAPDCAGGPQPLATGTNVLSLSTDGTHVVWASVSNPGDVQAAEAATGTVSTVFAADNYPRGAAIDQGNVYWVSGHGTMLTCPVAGCTAAGPATFATYTGTGPDLLAVAGGNAVFDDYYGSDVKACPVADCAAPTDLGTNAAIAFGGLGLDGTDALWTDQGVGLQRCPVTGCGGAPSTMTPSSATQPGAFAVDGQQLFVSGTSLLECPRLGCGSNPTVLAPGGAKGIAVDATYVYFTTGLDGRVLRVPR